MQDFTEQLQYRPVPISTWYPAQQTEENHIYIDDYLQVLKQEEEWENLPDSFILDWFYYPRNPVTEKNRDYPTQAFNAAIPSTGKFPVIIYSPSYNAASTENFMLCEYLASHGYLVVSAPSNGAKTMQLAGGRGADAGAQQRDLDYLFGYASRLPNADITRVYTVGFSFGGLSNVPFPMSNRFIDGVISLDGTVKYNLPVVAALPGFDAGKLQVPFVHFTQKPIPEAVLSEEKIDPDLSENFVFMDSLGSAPAYEFGSADLTHGQFPSFGILFEPRDERQDRAEELIH